MSVRHKHMAKNHEIAKKLEFGSEIAKVPRGGHRGEMVTNVPHQCVRQAQNRLGLCRKYEKKIFFFSSQEPVS